MILKELFNKINNLSDIEKQELVTYLMKISINEINRNINNYVEDQRFSNSRLCVHCNSSKTQRK